MNFTVNTEALQEMVSKVICCSSNNKLIPLTSLMSIKVKDNKLTLTTTNSTDYFYANFNEKVDCENFEVSVIADTFTKLIQKTTSKTVNISVENNILTVKGNGTYKIELPLDENGNAIKFPNKLPASEPVVMTTIKKSVVDKILNYNKPSLAVSVDMPALCSYYCGDKVISSNRELICCTDIKLFESDLLITSPLMDLLGVMTDEAINVNYDNDHMVFWTKEDTIVSPITDGKDSFPATAVLDIAASELPSTCKVDKGAVLNMLERLSLFVSSYDKKEIRLTFVKDGIMFSSKQSSGTELVPFKESTDFSEFDCGIDIEMFKAQVSTQETETLDIAYGSEDFIKMSCGNVVQLVALADEEGEE